jgi:hypothetical protein
LEPGEATYATLERNTKSPLPSCHLKRVRVAAQSSPSQKPLEDALRMGQSMNT